MKKFLSLVVSVTILTGAYFWSFGVPNAVSNLLGVEESAAPETAARRGRPGGGGATTVVLTPLELRPYEDVLRAIGSAEALHSASVSSDVTGKVTEVNLKANTKVLEGDVLVQLDARVEAFNLETAESELSQASDTVSRYVRLQETGNSTVSAVAISEARLAQRLAELKVGLAQLALADRTVRAPISGTLGLSDVNVGDTISANNTFVTIDDAVALLVEFELPERSISLLSEGLEVLLGTPSFTGRVFEGEIVSFDSRLDSVTRSVTVEARVENPDGLLWPGMTFSVRVPHESKPLAVLPSTAITWSREGSRIWVANEGVASQVLATILYRRDEQVWVEVDVPIGTMVVTEGAQKLRDGASITNAGEAPQERRPKRGDGVAGSQRNRPAEEPA